MHFFEHELHFINTNDLTMDSILAFLVYTLNFGR